MENRILRLEVHDHSLHPAEVELRVTVIPERRTPTTELRGRLMGPRCPYSNTVEIAYPLRPLNRPSESLSGLTMRVILPEASPWDPESPFLYQGPIELWQDGHCCHRVQVSHGLRHISLGARGLLWNGRALQLRGWAADDFTETELQRRRQQGFNLIVASATKALWEVADRIGLLVLGRVSFIETETIGRLHDMESHPSCLGWLLDAGLLGHPDMAELLARTRCGVLLGGMAIDLPPGVRFVAGLVEQLEAGPSGLPRLLSGKPREGPEMPPGLLGWVE